MLRCLKRSALAVLLGGAAWPVLALGQVMTYDEFITQHVAAIERVETCGRWGQGDSEGRFRFFIGSHYAQNLLFIDMLRTDHQTGTLSVTQGFTVPAFNNDHAEIVITAFRCVSEGPDRIRISGHALNGHDTRPANGGGRFEFCVQLDARTRQLSYADTRLGAALPSSCKRPSAKASRPVR
jgi:hypothetical protein